MIKFKYIFIILITVLSCKKSPDKEIIYSEESDYADANDSGNLPDILTETVNEEDYEDICPDELIEEKSGHPECFFIVFDPSCENMAATFPSDIYTEPAATVTGLIIFRLFHLRQLQALFDYSDNTGSR
jgi:hypothetical protein